MEVVVKLRPTAEHIRRRGFRTINLHKRLLKARKLGLNANPHLRKTNVSGSFLWEQRNLIN